MTLKPSVMSEITEMRGRKTFPAKGRCRVKVCGAPYSRESGGRKGMCKVHYRVSKKLVDNKETTWDDIDEEFPMDARTSLPMLEAKLSEVEFQNHVVDLIRSKGHAWWVLDATRQRGVPDLLILTKDGRVLFRELKAAGGYIEDQQKALMASMKEHGNDVAVWQPNDWHSGRIDKELDGEQLSPTSSP